MEELRDKCGVFGVYNNDKLDVARTIHLALYALQHRGQESCGIAVCEGNKIKYHKDKGLISENFTPEILSDLKGNIGIGHVRYATAGSSSDWMNYQPLVLSYRDGMMAVAHNGNLVNTKELASQMGDLGSVFITDSDTELMIKYLTRYMVAEPSIEKAVKGVMRKVKGSYAIAMMLPGMLIGFRDPHGIRPLCLGKIKNSYMLSSESCAFTAIGGEFIRDIQPGEIVVIDKDGLHSYQGETAENTHLCIFEYVYFARSDSYMDNASVHRARLEAGAILAKESPVEADLVVGVPDSALSAALGYARESGIPYGHGLMRNRYVGRTFIQPTQNMRDAAVKIKFSPLRNEIEGKRIVMVDDSIVRGTTTRIIVQMLKNVGAKEVHLRISSPPVKYPCFYGIDTANASQLIASRLTIDEIRELIGADSLAYLSLDGLRKTPVGIQCGLCDACFTGNYCVPVEDHQIKMKS